MTSRPILFKGAMVRALLSGAKTQTRRICKPQPPAHTHKVLTYHYPDPRDHFWAYVNRAPNEAELSSWVYPCPYGQPGDKLWVRESFAHVYRTNAAPLARSPDDLAYMADDMTPDRDLYGAWKPSIHMPRWASRITLEIVSVRVERLQDISEADARAEGITDGGCTTCGNPEPCGCAAPAPDARDAYCNLWGQINGPDSWTANSWVWVVEFKVVTK